MTNKLFIYEGYQYVVIHVGLMKKSNWKRFLWLSRLGILAGSKWVNCVIYQSVGTNKISVRELSDFKKRFKPA